jgi:hypothetical protein
LALDRLEWDHPRPSESSDTHKAWRKQVRFALRILLARKAGPS